MTATPIYSDASSSVEDRASDLIDRMDLDEKLAQLGAVGFPNLMKGDRFDEAAALQVIPHGIGQVTRIGATTGLQPAQSAELVNQIQRLVVERTAARSTRHCARGVPGRLLRPGRYGLPPSVSTGQRLGSRAHGGGGVGGQAPAYGRGCPSQPRPGARRGPRPRWGRLEGDLWRRPGPRRRAGCGLRERNANERPFPRRPGYGQTFFGSQPLRRRAETHTPVQIGPRELREVYAEPFAAAIREAGLASVIELVQLHRRAPRERVGRILTTLLRGELGFEGIAVADYSAISLLASYHRVAADRSEAASRPSLPGWTWSCRPSTVTANP